MRGRAISAVGTDGLLWPQNQSASPPIRLPLLAGVDLETFGQTCNLVSMTRKSKAPGSSATGRRGGHPRSGRWLLQDAKARFSELVRRVRAEGPQVVTVHGREAVVLVSAEEFRRLKGNPTGRALVDVLRQSPLRDVDIEPRRDPLPVRDVTL